MRKKELLKRIEALEARVEELEKPKQTRYPWDYRYGGTWNPGGTWTSTNAYWISPLKETG